MSEKTAETPMYLEHAGRTYRRTVGAEAEDACLRQRQDAIKARLVALAGGAAEARGLLARLEDLSGEEERLAVERLFSAVGELVVRYSARGPLRAGRRVGVLVGQGLARPGESPGDRGAGGGRRR